MKKKEMKKIIRECNRQNHCIPAGVCLNSETIEKYYDELIFGIRKPRSGTEAYIQSGTMEDAGRVLAYLGLNHPASPAVLRYLADQKLAAGTKEIDFFTEQIRSNSHQNTEKRHDQ